MKKVYILTEGSNTIGVGHIMRCLSLYEELLERGYDAELFIYGGRGIESYLLGLNHRIMDWFKCDLSIFKNTVCIIDSYLADTGRLSEISSVAGKCMYIDDNNEREYPKGIVINPSLFGGQLSYPVKPGVKYLLGGDYVILRKPFRQKINRQINTDIKELMVTIGGTDVLGLTHKIFRILKPFTYVKKNIISSNPDKNMLKEADETFCFFKNLTASEMKDILLKSDIVISAAGQTCYELVQLSTPSILIETAANQRNNIKAMIYNNLAAELGVSEIESGLAGKIASMDYTERQRLASNMDNYDFSNGVSNIINEV